MAIRFKIKGEKPENDDVEMEVSLRRGVASDGIILRAKVGRDERNIFILYPRGTGCLCAYPALPGLQTDEKGKIILED